jgi:hypothetical protein
MKNYQRIVAVFLAAVMFLGPNWPLFVRTLYAQPAHVNPPRTTIGLKPLVDQLMAATSDTLDTDGDGIPDSVEAVIGTDPNSADSDLDRLSDAWEIDNDTDPMNPDSNFDGIPDYLEVTDVPSLDIDGDGIPNAWDYDNDGDGVNDAADLSPSAKTELQDQFHFDITTDGNPTFITLQITPSHPEYLSLYGRTWDWPDNDREGSVQDWDNSKDDVLIFPQLQVTANVTPDLAEALVHGVTIEENTLTIPLMPMREHGKTVAFGGRIPYPSSTPQNLVLDAKLIWKVVGFIDPNETDLNQQTVLATYNDSFSIAGMTVEESAGTEVGIFYSPDLNQTVAANLLMAWQFLKNSENHIADMPAVLDTNNINVWQQMGAYTHRDSALANIANAMVPDALDALPADANLPIITLMEDSTASLDLSEFNTTAPNNFTIDTTSQPYMTTKSLKTNWYNTSARQVLETDAIMGEIQSLGQSQETTYSLMTLMLFWNTGQQTLIGPGMPNTDPGDDFELVPDVAEKIAGGLMSGLEILYRSKVGLAGLDTLRSLRLLQAKGWSIAVGSTDLTKLGKLGKFKTWLRQCDNITDSTKMFKKLTKVCDVLDVIAIGIDVGFAIYSFIAIAQSNDLSGIALASANMMVAFELIYSFILLGISLIPYVGWLIALVIELSDIIGDWSEDFISWLVDCFTNVDYVPEMDVDIVGDATISIDDKDFNGTDVGDRIEYRSRLKSTVTATQSYWSLVQKSYIYPYYKIYAPAGSGSVTGASYEMTVGALNLPITDWTYTQNITEGWKAIEYESGVWIEPGKGMPNFPVYLELNSYYQNWYAWSWWLFGWWHEEDYQGGSSMLGGFTCYFDVMPATLADFVRWRGITCQDNDGDGILNSEETNSNPWLLDTDSDGLTDKFEIDNGLNPRDYDTDGDVLIDWFEVQFGTDPLNADTDGDGLFDYMEISGWTIQFEYAGQTFTTRVYSDPTIPDTDGDGVSDYQEYLNGLNPRSRDTNGDGIGDTGQSQIPEAAIEFVKHTDFNVGVYVKDTAVDADGFIYVLTEDSVGSDYFNIITKYDPDFNEVSAWSWTTPDWTTGMAGDMLVDNDNQLLYVPSYFPTDGFNHSFNIKNVSLLDGSQVGNLWATRSELEVSNSGVLAFDRDADDNFYLARSGGWLHWSDYSYGVYSFVDVYDSAKNHVNSWGDFTEQPTELDKFGYIKKIAFNPANGLLYICDQGYKLHYFSLSGDARFRPDRVALFTADGQYLQDLPDYHKDGQHYTYESLADLDVDSQGNVYVLDEGNYRIHKQEQNGLPITSCGGYGDLDGQFSGQLNKITVDSNKNIFVIESFGGDMWFYRLHQFREVTSNLDPNEPVIVPDTNPDRDGDGLLNETETAGWEVTYTEPNGVHTVAAVSDPMLTDTDLDGLTDLQEQQLATNPQDSDTDNDGVGDYAEILAQTDPKHYDSDDDGLSDGTEATFGSNPNLEDTDGDGLTDKQEFDLGTDPNNTDTDGDGLNDAQEVEMGTNPLSPDSDGDFMFDGQENDQGTDPNNNDTDNDGLTDGMETVVHNTDPADDDSDGDGVKDGVEIDLRLDANNEDTDGDGVPDGTELDEGSNPFVADSDHDGIPDGQDQVGNLPPVTSSASASPEILWPANNKYIPISIQGITDPEGDPIQIGIVSVTSDEPSSSGQCDKYNFKGRCDKNKNKADAYVDDNGVLFLKAERDGRGNGRVYEINFMAADDKGQVAPGKVQVKVPHSKKGHTYKCVDDGQKYEILSFLPNEAPDVSAACASKETLWPANRRFEKITIQGVTDPEDDKVCITITDITSDEPVAFSKWDPFKPDAFIIGKNFVLLRAERNGHGNGRVYEITFIAKDSNDNESTGTVQVCVPSSKGQACIDDGQNYDPLPPSIRHKLPCSGRDFNKHRNFKIAHR